MSNKIHKLLFPAINVANLDGDYRKSYIKTEYYQSIIDYTNRQKQDLIDEYNQARPGLLGKYLAKITDFGGEERHKIELEKIDKEIEGYTISRDKFKSKKKGSHNISEEERALINTYADKFDVKSNIYADYNKMRKNISTDEANILIKELLNNSNILIQFLSRSISNRVCFESIETNFGKYDIEKDHDGNKRSDREFEIINLIFGENKIRTGFNHNEQVVKSLHACNTYNFSMLIGDGDSFSRELLNIITSFKEIYLNDESYKKYIHDFSELLVQLDETLKVLFYGKNYSKFDSLKDEIEKIIDINSVKKMFEKYGIHNYNTSRNVTYCKSCGCTSSKTNKDCSKQKGHDFLVQKVEGIWRPYCKSCGIEGSNIPSNQNCTSRV
jgi:hypothetical protein